MPPLGTPIISDMIRLSIAIAASDALPSAFVVFRGFEDSIHQAAKLGLDGVELALKSAGEINPARLTKWLENADLEISCISTGQVFADTGLMFTDAHPERRNQVKMIFKELIDLASDFGQMVNIGRVRGRFGSDPSAARQYFMSTVSELCEYADVKGVTLILEPVNRYEIDFINSVEEGVEMLKGLGLSNLKLMPDTFHMNIEDTNIAETLSENISDIAYIHFADSNRLAPGQGHINFDRILSKLGSVSYQGWVSLEILPKPSPEIAARQAADFLRPRIQEYNKNLN